MEQWILSSNLNTWEKREETEINFFNLLNKNNNKKKRGYCSNATVMRWKFFCYSNATVITVVMLQ